MELSDTQDGNTIAKLGDLFLNPSPGGSEAFVVDPEQEDRFTPMPECRNQVASHIHCVGPSGAGKTTWANAYATAFRQYTGGQVICISADGHDDPNLDCDVRYAVSSPEFMALTLDDLVPLDRMEDPPILVIFDDIEGLPGPEMKAVRVFEQAVKERGRKFNVHSISVYHKGANSGSTKASLNEATKFVVFPTKITQNCQYMLDKYCGVKPEISAMLNRSDFGRYAEITPGETVITPIRAIKLDPQKLSALAKAEKRRTEAEAVKHVRLFK